MASPVGDGAFRDRRRAESFGAIAEQYDRARPAYPAALFDELATLGGTEVLDVGCGTGKAAVQLAARGMRVLGVEVDPGMAAVARTHGVEVEVCPFEEWDDRGRTFDLVTSAQAWHWVDPYAGAHKAFRVLRPDGTVALFWNVHAIAPELRERFDAVYEWHAPILLGRMNGLASRGSRSAEHARPGLEAAGFTDSCERRYDWLQTYTRAEWLDLLVTFSDHQLLAEPARTELLSALGDAVDELGGTLTVEYSTLVLLARR
ncbi:class I SAM-dependent methyltransferase [uncultured Jatrophihabitans sp.]|uniref:class I SAM-dependent methyltransferase n=1 Tax=uncultured Jatrophihabitans sp. TaxID=1610747 RepID=UPI0035CC51F4